MARPAAVPAGWLAAERPIAGPALQLQPTFLSNVHTSSQGTPPLLLALSAPGPCSSRGHRLQHDSDQRPASFSWAAPLASITSALLTQMQSSISRPATLLASITGSSGPGAWSPRLEHTSTDHSRKQSGRHGEPATAELSGRYGRPAPAELAGEPAGRYSRSATAAPPGPAQPPQAQPGQEEGEAMSESEEDSQDSEVLMPRGARLNKRDVTVFCSTCRHNTLFDEPEDLIECSCCHRVYHMACYERHVSRTEGIAPPDDSEEGLPWFHSQACRKVHNHIRKETALGERPIDPTQPPAGPTGGGSGGGLFSWLPWQQSGPRTPSQHQSAVLQTDAQGQSFHTVQALEAPEASWRLMQCGAQASPASRIAMSQVYNLLSRDFAYTLGDYGSFDLAALLRRHGKPVCAAIVDVYGPDVAEVFVMATHKDVRRQGNCRLLMQQLAGSLHAAGVRRMVVSIDDDDENARMVWDKLGFQPLEGTVLRQLSWSLPAFSSEATEGTLYLGQELRAKKGLLA